MNKTTQKIFSFLLVLALLISCSVNTFALTADKEWESYYEACMQDGKGILMSPGSDDTQRNFSWYSPVKAGKCYVEISKTPDFTNAKNYYGSYILTPDGDRSNKVTVTNLEADTTYYYKCVTEAGISETASFSTLSSKSFTAMYVTDIHVTENEDDCENSLVHQSYTFDRVIKQAESKKNLDLIISAGDQATHGRRSEYLSVFASPELRSIPFALCVGNHDRKGVAYKYFNNNPNKNKKGLSSFIGNDYWYVKGDVLFMVFDSNCTSAATHRNFVKAAIKANPNVKWRVASMHHDLFGRLSDSRLDDADKNRRPVFVPIFDEFNFDLVLLGHSHYYSISNVLYNGETTQSLSEADSVTDANGTIYMVSGSINHPRTGEDTPLAEQNAKSYITDEVIYNLIDFSEDSIKINSYTYGSDNPFNTFTINKTTQQGGHPEYKKGFFDPVKRGWYEFLALFEEFGIMIGEFWKTYVYIED